MKQIKLSIISILILGLASCTQRRNETTESAHADAIYYGGDILTMEGDSATYAQEKTVK